MKKRNIEKAQLLYDYLDNSKLFVGTVEKNSRSLMNVPFIVNPAVKGNRTVGGMRASIYNAMSK